MFKSHVGGPGPHQIFRKSFSGHFEFIKFYFPSFFCKTHLKTTKTSHFANFGAPGVLNTAPACIFHHI